MCHEAGIWASNWNESRGGRGKKKKKEKEKKKKKAWFTDLVSGARRRINDG